MASFIAGTPLETQGYFVLQDPALQNPLPPGVCTAKVKVKPEAETSEHLSHASRRNPGLFANVPRATVHPSSEQEQPAERDVSAGTTSQVT